MIRVRSIAVRVGFAGCWRRREVRPAAVDGAAADYRSVSLRSAGSPANTASTCRIRPDTPLRDLAHGDPRGLDGATFTDSR